MRDAIIGNLSAGVCIAILYFGGLLALAHGSLSDVQKLKAENYLLKRRLLTAECQSGIQQLESERTKLEADFIAVQSCETGWNWDTLTCAKPAEAPEKAEEKK